MGFSVFALGGAGAVGSETTRALLAASDLERLTIADHDVGRAQALADYLADRRVAVEDDIDVNDVAGTADKARGHDVLLNTLFWDQFDNALNVACDAGCNYADLLSHPSESHRATAQQAGITAISGLGASPGIGNVLGMRGCQQFERPVSVEISCTSFRPIAPSLGLLDTLVELASPGLPERGYFFDGRFIPTQPLEGSKLVNFAAPVGNVMVYYINHSEVTSFPRHFPTLRYVAVRGSYRPQLVHEMHVLAEYGLLENQAVPTLEGGKTSVRRFVRDRLWERFGGREDFDSQHLFLHVEVTGRTESRHGRATYLVSHPLEWHSQAIPRMTGIGAAVGTTLLARQGRTHVGIRDPEEYYDSEEFLTALKAYDGVSYSESIVWS